MKKFLITSAAIALATAPVNAGSLSEPATEVPVEEAIADGSSASSSGGKVWIPLLIVGAIVAIAIIANNDDDAPAAGGGAPSDVRLKRNITRVGTAKNGLPIYRYQYLWSAQYYEGVMAQDVLKHTPSAITKGLFGVLLVKYDELGMKMRAVS